MQPNSLASRSPMSIDGDVNQLIAWSASRSNSPERCRRPVAEEGVGTASKNGGHPMPVSSQAGSPNREYAAANRVQPTLPDPMLDRLGMPAETQELPPRNGPV